MIPGALILLTAAEGKEQDLLDRINKLSRAQGRKNASGLSFPV